MWLVRKIIQTFLEVRYRFVATRSIVKVKKGGTCTISSNVKIVNSRITVEKGVSLTIDSDCILSNVYIHLAGTLNIGRYNLIGNKGKAQVAIMVSSGELVIGDYNRVDSNILIRYGGILTIGDRNNINDGTEIRVDENVTIGNYNQISYECVIWDTNTHNIYEKSKRRELTNKYYPIFGYEYERPKTKRIQIGDDCWIGRRSAILKGVQLGNECIVGYNTLLSNCNIEAGTTVVNKIENIVSKRN